MENEPPDQPIEDARMPPISQTGHRRPRTPPRDFPGLVSPMPSRRKTAVMEQIPEGVEPMVAVDLSGDGVPDQSGGVSEGAAPIVEPSLTDGAGPIVALSPQAHEAATGVSTDHREESMSGENSPSLEEQIEYLIQESAKGTVDSLYPPTPRSSRSPSPPTTEPSTTSLASSVSFMHGSNRPQGKLSR